MQTKTRLKAVVVAIALVFGVVAGVAGAPPASAQTLTITSFTMQFTNSPYIVNIYDDGVDCVIAMPTTNCGAAWYGGFFNGAVLLFNLALYALDAHFAVNSLAMHLPDWNLPACLLVMQGQRLIDLDAEELFTLLGVLGSYSITNCSLTVTATLTLWLGGSPSATHLDLHVTTGHV